MDKDTKHKESHGTQLLKNKRKSERINKKDFTENEMQLINCHCCKVVDSAYNMITCCRSNCRESFCLNCIKKHYFKFNTNTFLTLKEYEAINRWICYKCKKKCACRKCENVKEIITNTTVYQQNKHSKRRIKKNKIYKNKKEKKIRLQKPLQSKNINEFENIIFEEYDESMMKAIDFIDEYCIYENEASISDSVIEKYYFENFKKEHICDKKEEPVFENNIQPVRMAFKSERNIIKKKEKKMIYKRKIKEMHYQVEQKNNNITINIDDNKDQEDIESLNKEIILQTCIICKKSTSEFKLIKSYHEFICFFKNISETVDNKTEDFIGNLEKINENIESFNNFENPSLNIILCYDCSKNFLFQKSGFDRLSRLILESSKNKKKIRLKTIKREIVKPFKVREKINDATDSNKNLKNLINSDTINLFNDKTVIENENPNPLGIILEELKNQIITLERFTNYQNLLVYKIFSQCEEYLSLSINNFSKYDITLCNIKNLNNFYPFIDINDGNNNITVLKNLQMYNMNLVKLFCLNVEVLKNHFSQFTAKYENYDDKKCVCNNHKNSDLSQFLLNGLLMVPQMNFSNTIYQMNNIFTNNNMIQDNKAIHKDVFDINK